MEEEEEIKTYLTFTLSNELFAANVAGIQNILTKCMGTNNPHNVVKATVMGLRSLQSREAVAARRGKTVDEI